MTSNKKLIIGDEGSNERIVYMCGSHWCVQHGEYGAVSRHLTRRTAVLEATRGVISDALQFSDELRVSVAAEGVRIIRDGWIGNRCCDIVLGLAVLHTAREWALENGDTECADYIAGYIKATIAALYGCNVTLLEEDIALAAAQVALEHFVNGKPWSDLVSTALHEIGLTQDCKNAKEE